MRIKMMLLLSILVCITGKETFGGAKPEMRRYTFYDWLWENLPFAYGGKPRLFWEDMAAMPKGRTVEGLLAYYGEPTGVLWPKDIPTLFSEEPWRDGEEKWVRLWHDQSRALDFIVDGSYRDYAMFELWNRLQPAGRLSTYDPRWHEHQIYSNAVAWVYSMPDIFGRRSFSTDAHFLFIRNGKLIARTRVYRDTRETKNPTLNGDRSVLLSREEFYKRYPDAGKTPPAEEPDADAEPEPDE